MKQDTMTQWADAGLAPSPEAMRDHLLTGLLQEGSQAIPPDYPQLLRQAGIDCTGPWFGLIELRAVAVDAFSYIRGLDSTAYSEAQLTVHLSQRMQLLLEGQHDVFLFKVQSQIMCILSGQNQTALVQRQEAVCKTLMSLEQEVDGIRLFAACSDILEGYPGLAQARCQVKALFEHRALHPEIQEVLHTEILHTLSGHQSTEESIREHAVMNAFKTGHYRTAMALFGELFEGEYLAYADPLLLLKHKCAQYIYGLVTATQEICGNSLEEELAQLAPERRLLFAESYVEVRAQMEHIFGRLNDLVIAAQKAGSAQWISQVKDYIRGHYTDPDLNVNKLSDVFDRNPSYLSRSFLRLTGQSVLDYIHRYRIQEAKILIGQGATLAVVAQQVGYSNVLTMSRAFKKYEGTTPGKLKN